MKEIKAYVRPERAEEILDALDREGISGMTVINVEAIGIDCDPEHARISVHYVERFSKANP